VKFPAVTGALSPSSSILIVPYLTFNSTVAAPFNWTNLARAASREFLGLAVGVAVGVAVVLAIAVGGVLSAGEAVAETPELFEQLVSRTLTAKKQLRIQRNIFFLNNFYPNQ
jgi:hypothetical protein